MPHVKIDAAKSSTMKRLRSENEMIFSTIVLSVGVLLDVLAL
jgi:hypothetical protein